MRNKQEALSLDPVTNAYIMRVVVSVWRWMVATLGLGNMGAGALLTFGPPRLRASPNFNFFELIDLSDQIWPVTLMVSGLAVLISLFVRNVFISIGSHVVAFVALMWWGIVALGYLIDGKSITGSGTVYIIELAIIHLLAVVSQILVLYALRED